MEPYAEDFQAQHNRLRLTIGKNQLPNWEELSTLFRVKLGEGVRNLELDLRHLSQIDSLGLGMLVGINMVAENAGGTFRVLVIRGSNVFNLMRLTRLGQIVQIIELIP